MYVVMVEKLKTRLFYQIEEAGGQLWFTNKLKEATRFHSKVLAERLASTFPGGMVWRLKPK